MITPVESVRAQCAGQPHAPFLALLPRIERHARIYFHDVRCPGRREDAVQECLALGWRWLLGLAARGKDVSRFPAAFASLVARAVRGGRGLVRGETMRDALSPR